MLECSKCHEIFEYEDLKVDYTEGGYYGELHYSCPYCGNDELDEVEQCARCGKHLLPEELHGTVGSLMCDDCIDEVADVRTVLEYGYDNSTEVDGINGLFAYVYSAGEINDILLAHFTQMSEEKQNKWVSMYVGDDKSEFADWYDEGGTK